MPSPRPLLRSAVFALALLALSGCAANAPTDMARTETASPAEAAKPAVNPRDTQPVEFNLGPNRFVLPANVFVDGRGPDFQGGVTLALLWPELTPYPPGQPYASFNSGPMRDHGVIVTLTYIDRVPINELPERYIRTTDGDREKDPSRNLALRVREPDRFGLEHYRTDLDKVALHSASEMQRPLRPSESYLGAHNDWFVRRDAEGRVRTVVMCDDAREPEGFQIHNEELVRIPEAKRWPLCDSHLFALPEYSLSSRAGYHRPVMRDWQSIELAVRQLMNDAHRPPAHAP